LNSKSHSGSSKGAFLDVGMIGCTRGSGIPQNITQTALDAVAAERIAAGEAAALRTQADLRRG
jgi:hypothetical protein